MPARFTDQEKHRSLLRECWISGYALRMMDEGLAYSDAQEAAERAWHAVPWRVRRVWLGVREAKNGGA